MKSFDHTLISNTSSIAPFTNNDTNVYPFIKSAYYIVNLLNYNQTVDEKTIEFTNLKLDEQSNIKISPKLGFLKGTFIMKDDFDEPLEEFDDYM